MKFKFDFELGGSRKMAGHLAPQTSKKTLSWKPKATSRTRQDIKSWTQAINLTNSETPRNYAIQLLYNEILTDALLFGQIENRRQQVFSSDFLLKKPNGEVDEEQTARLKNMPGYRALTQAILDSVYFGYNLVELNLVKSIDGSYVVEVTVIPRTNVVPKTGLFYPDYSDDLKSTAYRELAEFGTWILEFNRDDIGLLNKTVSHTLFKRFAQSCWSELCEIYGIPPRTIKTNTQDSAMLDRAEKMMQDSGSAPWFIIDDAETLEWGQATVTRGEVFESLINLCNNEISIVINGAVIGQDTKHGNRSKEESSQEMLWLLVQSDMALVEQEWNNKILPAFKKLGVIKGDVRFEFEPAEDTGELWKRTSEALQYYNVDPEWVKEKFGIEITGERQSKISDPEPGKKKLKLNGFFD